MILRCCLALLLSGCAIELDDVPGRACDDLHPCRAPRSCVEGVCFSEAELGDGGVVVDAGSIRWQQRVDGFDGTSVDPSCSLTIDASRGNLVISSIAGPDDDDDTARAFVNQLPQSTEGKLRGRFSLPSATPARNELPFLSLGQPAWLRAGLDGQGRFVVQSDAQTLGNSALVERFTIDGGFVTGEYLVELEWKAGAFRRVSLNGARVADTAVSGGSSAAPTELSLGIERYDGDAGSAFSVRLFDWQLADAVTVPLGDAP